MENGKYDAADLTQPHVHEHVPAKTEGTMTAISYYNTASELALKLGCYSPDAIAMIEIQLQIAYVSGQIEQAEIERDKLIKEAGIDHALSTN